MEDQRDPLEVLVQDLDSTPASDPAALVTELRSAFSIAISDLVSRDYDVVDRIERLEAVLGLPPIEEDSDDEEYAAREFLPDGVILEDVAAVLAMSQALAQAVVSLNRAPSAELKKSAQGILLFCDGLLSALGVGVGQVEKRPTVADEKSGGETDETVSSPVPLTSEAERKRSSLDEILRGE